MPLYEYRCHKCGNVFEVMQKFADEPVKVHADCGGEVEKLISRSAFQLKGSGWYVTDYAKSGATKEPKPGKTEGGGNGDAKSDSKSGDSKSGDSKSTGSDAKSSDSSSSASSSGSGSGAATPSSSTPSSSSESKT